MGDGEVTFFKIEVTFIFSISFSTTYTTFLMVTMNVTKRLPFAKKAVGKYSLTNNPTNNMLAFPETHSGKILTPQLLCLTFTFSNTPFDCNLHYHPKRLPKGYPSTKPNYRGYFRVTFHFSDITITGFSIVIAHSCNLSPFNKT